MKAVDLFCGVGWGVACKRLGIEEIGFDIWEPVKRTRDAVGMVTEYGDLSQASPLHPRWRDAELLIASPPCQEFSTLGKKASLGSADLLASAIRGQADAPALTPGQRLTIEPLRWIQARLVSGNPYRYIAMEQVPAVLPIWEAYRDRLRDFGYSAEAGILKAGDFGVPQIRKRAILVARMGGDAKLPSPSGRKIGFAEALGLKGDWTMVGQDVHPPGPDGIKRRHVRYSPGPGSAVRRSTFKNHLVPGHIEPPASTLNKGWEKLGPQRCGVLQTFPADFPWQASGEELCLLIGNAVPPNLAQAVLSALLDNP